MVRTRPCRHAHTCGLTYCTVREAVRLELLGEAEIEFLVVDADEHVRPPFDECARERAAQR